MKSNEIIGPQPGPQTQFLQCPADIAIYAGGAGSGKSFALLLEAARHIGNPGYRGILFRESLPQLKSAGGLWDTSCMIYPHLGGEGSRHHMEWRFKSGARIAMRPLETPGDRFGYAGLQVSFMAFDELAEGFDAESFWYLQSRLRSTAGIRPYCRCATNPVADSWVHRLCSWWVADDGFPIAERAGRTRWFHREGEDMHWADSREELVAQFPDAQPRSLAFFPAKLADNAALCRADRNYESALKSLPRHERERLLYGNWNARASSGTVFRKEWFRIVDAAPATTNRVRAWDIAATSAAGGRDPDWTVGVLMSRLYGHPFTVEDVVRLRGTPLEVERAIRATAEQDGKPVSIILPVDPGAAGKIVTSNWARVLEGFRMIWTRPTQSKIERAGPASSQAEAGNVQLVKAPFNDAFLRELEAFPSAGSHDDQVDAFTDALNTLATSRRILVA
jgi:predicted phage terminase large subunit-like protein